VLKRFWFDPNIAHLSKENKGEKRVFGSIVHAIPTSVLYSVLRLLVTSFIKTFQQKQNVYWVKAMSNTIKKICISRK